MPPVQFATNSYKSLSLPVSSERTVNAYPEREPPDAKTQVAVFGSPGINTFQTLGAGPIRGMHVMNDVLYVVSGGTFYSVALSGAVTALGGTVTGTNIVSMADNGTQIAIVNGVNGYIWSQVGGFQVISDPNFHPANTVTFFDDYFVFDWAGTNKFFISSPLDGTTYSGLDFASAEVNSDFVIATVNQQENLLIFGERTIETWYDSGAVDFPFLRVNGGTIERGCGAAQTIIKEDNAVFFLGDDLIFYRLGGIQLQRISTHAIEAAWQQYATASDAFAFSYSFDGHKFISVTFPTGNATWHYDIASGLWHERESLDMNLRNLGRWRGCTHARCYNQDFIGDAFSGKIGTLSSTSFTEFGNQMQMLLVSPPLHNDRKRIFVPVFEIDIETGVGLATGQGSDPQLMLDISRDGGRSYGNLQLWNSMGKIGAYQQRLRWLRLGQARSWTFRARCSDPVRRTIIAARADLSVGM